MLHLSAPVLAGLRNLGDGTNCISLDISKKLIANSLKLMLQPKATIPPVPEMYATYADRVKQSEYAVVTLWALAIRNSLDVASLRHHLLEEQKELSLSDAIVEELLRTYEDNFKDLLLRQLQLGHNFPHITDVQWRLVCDVKSSTSDCSSGEIGFQINLGRYETGESGGERITIAEFLCNTEELQLLVNKLKEIVRHCEKLSANE